jgi:exopolysaccharide production protein ExoY
MSRLKRATDVLVSSVALLVLLPVLLLIALAIKLDSRGPVLYRSERIGTSGRRFFLLKFRTMKHNAGGDLDLLLQDAEVRTEFARTHKLRDDPRITRVGRWLRRASLDELPQLLDVLRSELSLVGPRPITAAEFDALEIADSVDQAWTGVHGYWDMRGLRPGLTGLWQINGRSTIDFEERVRLDKLYLTNWSFRLDLLILAKTLRSVASTTGAY